MRSGLLGPVPEGARTRLSDHYGDSARTWLGEVPEALTEAAARHRVVERLRYHDWGHASVIAHGRTEAGQGMVFKAMFDPERLSAESAALAFWGGREAPRLFAVETDLRVQVTELVEPGPGGAGRPQRELLRVAGALHRLHDREPGAVGGIVPSLADYYATEVAVRMADRHVAAGHVVDRGLVDEASRLAACLPREGRRRLLHGDLYRENVLFDPGGRVVFIDPLPKIGPPVFDWAFWCVYYDFDGGLTERLRIATGQVDDAELLKEWCLLLAVDGLLFFLSINDIRRAARATDVLATLRGATTARHMIVK